MTPNCIIYSLGGNQLGKAHKAQAPRKQISSWEQAISPIDYRYWRDVFDTYLSVGASIKYQLRYQQAIAKVHCDLGRRSPEVYAEFQMACAKVSTRAVYKEEDRIRHDVQSLVNSVNRGAGIGVKTTTNLAATSYDTISSADAARFREFVLWELLPAAKGFLEVMVDKVERYKRVLQIGRTHKQHATPVTFGFALAWHLDRIGDCVEQVEYLAGRLIGKYSGPVGVHAGLATIVDDPKKVERLVLTELGLVPGRISSQITRPEPLARLLIELVMLLTALTNLAEDMRNLSATEVGEVSEPFLADQVGSAGMPHKRFNPINFETSIGEWMNAMPRVITVFLTMISDHQRDLRNSMPMRTFAEIFAYAYVTLATMTRAMKTLNVDEDRCRKNLAIMGDLILSEQVKIILMEAGHPRAYKVAQNLAKEAAQMGRSLYQTVVSKRSLRTYLAKASVEQWEILRDPTKYIGTAITDAQEVALYWREYCQR